MIAWLQPLFSRKKDDTIWYKTYERKYFFVQKSTHCFDLPWQGFHFSSISLKKVAATTRKTPHTLTQYN